MGEKGLLNLQKGKTDPKMRLMLIVALVIILGLVAALPYILSDPAKRAARLADAEARKVGVEQWSAYATFLDRASRQTLS